mgnify:CR=1 FL=1
MDKNTIACFSLIGLVLVGFYWFNKPTEEQLAARQHYIDSVQQVKAEQLQQEQELAEVSKPIFEESDSDSLKLAKSTQIFGEFAEGGMGEAQEILLENNLVSITFSSKGAMVKKVVLKEYTNYQKQPLTLFSGEDNRFSIELATVSNRTLQTGRLNFKVASKTDTSITFAMPTTNGGSLDFVYTLPSNSYMLDFDIKANQLENILQTTTSLKATWKLDVPQQEKSHSFENRYAQIYYYSPKEGVDYLNETSNVQEELSEPIRWVAFKDQYFSSVLIADDEISSSKLISKLTADTSSYLKYYEAEMMLPYQKGSTAIGMRYFFGPNKYNLLKSYDKDLSGDEKLKLNQLVSLGKLIFRWINQIFSIPLFDFLGKFISNYGLIILIMTIIVKLIIFPLTYKSYLSTAKMRVLKPQIDEINQRIPAENQTERSQATMELYSKAGVNPMGGCLPMLLQMPILIALFYFFPNAIELRGESFLWAEDLSTYDAFITWGFNIPFIGDHLSLFCLLMTITNIVYTKINMASTDTGQMNQMPFMKYIMYFMPVMFLFIFNDYASGLSYYYFISLLITIIQTFVIRKYFVDEKKLLKQLQENQRKPMKKGTFLSRIEEMQKQQQAFLEQQKNIKK